MREDEESPQERFAYVSKTFGSNEEHSQRLYDYASRHWLSYSTPILSFGRSKRGLPISCFLPYLDDSAEGLVETLSEVNWLSMLGGGVGIGVGIRSTDDKSVGVMPHLRTYDASSLAYRQGRTRRGSYAAYLDISHPDIMMFLEMRKPTGDQNMRCLNLHHGINITDDFMHIIEKCMIDPNANDDWELKDPHNGEVREVVSAKHLWQAILEMRMQTGEPYIHYVDTSNRNLPPWQQALGLKVRQSNLCSEIILPTDGERTAVCCLSSLNLEYYDDWKEDKLFLKDVAEMLDNVLQHFIDNAPKQIKRAKYSAMRERSIGIGALGFHAYLQKNNLPWENPMTVGRNKAMFNHIRSKLNEANQELGKERGEAPDAKGTGNRFSHLMAKLDYNEVWSSIIANDGSVQHLDILDEWAKDVFKTSMEIDQRWIIQHAADRQEYIDQAQSLNLFFRPDVNVKYLHAIHFMAWKTGLKTLYYCRSEKIGKADKVAKKIERQVMQEIDLKQLATEESVCVACEG